MTGARSTRNEMTRRLVQALRDEGVDVRFNRIGSTWRAVVDGHVVGSYGSHGSRIYGSRTKHPEGVRAWQAELVLAVAQHHEDDVAAEQRRREELDYRLPPCLFDPCTRAVERLAAMK